MRTHNIPSKENQKDIPIMSPDQAEQALRLTLISSNYPCLEHLFVVAKEFEPLKFGCTALYKTKQFHF